MQVVQLYLHSFWPVDFGSIIRIYRENSQFETSQLYGVFFSAVNSLPLGSSVSLEHAQGYGVTGLFVSFIMTAQVNIFWKASSLRILLTEFLL